MTDPAFTALVERHRGELHAHCRRMVGTDAEDLVQETFLRAWRSRGTLRTTPRPWLYRIATNACLDAIARKRDTLPGDAIEEIADERADPVTAAERSERLAWALLLAAQHLPPKQRTVLILTDVLGWRAAETAELLGDSVAAVRSALQRARAGIAPHLRP
jgi:RNA polymerase sigma factor (sigma-70 family)